MRALWFAVVSIIPVVPVVAQDTTVAATDSLPFRRGQWAVQFGGGFNFASVGALKFRSPHRAWIVDIRLNGGHSETLASDSGVFLGLQSSADVSVRLGSRRYQHLGPKVSSLFTLGALAGYSHRATSSPAGKTETNGWQTGLFAELGGSYFVTQRLSFGAVGQVGITYGQTTATTVGGGGGTSFRNWSLSGSAGALQLIMTLYF